MPLIAIILLVKIALNFYSENNVQISSAPPLVSLTSLKRNYNAPLFCAFHTLELEHQGDLHGERRPLNQYNSQHLKKWFNSIDAISSKPDFLPFLVTFYYGASTTPTVLQSCVNFLEKHCDQNPAQKWRWLAHGLFLQRKIGVKDNIIKLSKKLSHYGEKYNLPLWIRDTHARLLSKRGQQQEAHKLFQAILDDSHSQLSLEEILFIKEMMHH